MEQFWVHQNAVLSISEAESFVLLANWLESEDGGHHLPYMPSDTPVKKRHRAIPMMTPSS